MRRIWTVGHSTRTLGEFLALLRTHGIDSVADVRRFPGSKRHPHFGSETLAGSLESAGIPYRWLPALGGRRTPLHDSPNTGWKNAAFRGYADYVGTADFDDGLGALARTAEGSSLVIMCAEAVWWRCHRRIIADVLTARGWEVRHVIDGSPAAVHVLDAPAHLVGGELSYAPIGSLGL